MSSPAPPRAAADTSVATLRRRRRARDRHGRGLRGPLAPPDLPLSRSRSDRFDDLVLDAVEDLDERWSRELAALEFAVEDIPPDGTVDLLEPVPLGRVDDLPEGRRRAVIYRRPIEARAPAGVERRDLVHDVVVEVVAEALGIDPDALDPPPRH